jgi:hypothetical protein
VNDRVVIEPETTKPPQGWLLRFPREGKSDCRQALAAFGTTAIDHGAAVFGCHAGTKTMGAGAVQIARLESTFGRHGAKPDRLNSGCERTFRITGPRILTMASRSVKDFVRSEMTELAGRIAGCFLSYLLLLLLLIFNKKKENNSSSNSSVGV